VRCFGLSLRSTHFSSEGAILVILEGATSDPRISPPPRHPLVSHCLPIVGRAAIANTLSYQ